MARNAPLTPSHTRADLSNDAVASFLPSGENETAVTGAEWPVRRAKGLEEACGCQRMTVKSSEAEARTSGRRGEEGEEGVVVNAPIESLAQVDLQVFDEGREGGHAHESEDSCRHTQGGHIVELVSGHTGKWEMVVARKGTKTGKQRHKGRHGKLQRWASKGNKGRQGKVQMQAREGTQSGKERDKGRE